jgi:hypothetical protein
MKSPTHHFFIFLACAVGVVSTVWTQVPAPVHSPEAGGYKAKAEKHAYTFTWPQILPAALFRTDSATGSLMCDLGDSTLFGRLSAGPEYFDEYNTDYFETRYAQQVEIVAGRCLLPVKPYFEPGNVLNVNRWTSGGVLGYRLDLLRSREGRPAHAGWFDGRVWFRYDAAGARPMVSITEGPVVALLQSDHPEWMVIAAETDRRSGARVEVEGVGTFTSSVSETRHEIRVAGLKPNTAYRYRFFVVDGRDTAVTPWLTFRSARVSGSGTAVTFAYAGDARGSSGGGEFSFLGVNRRVLSRLAVDAYRRGISFFLFGGDLISGFTNSIETFRMQLKSFKQALAPFLYTTPLYSAIGNHESLLHQFDDGSRNGIGMDRWPYRMASAEAVFAQELVQPENGPEPLPGLPPYRETAFTLSYGPVRIIVFNNNYWWTSHNRIAEFGGSPEGYILPEQLGWIERELEKAKSDTTVRYVLLLAQEPVFPGAGHVGDAMWHNGNNNVRAYMVKDGGPPQPFPMGIVEVRNRLWELVSRNPKVAAVLGSDEHNYQRLLIDARTPVGVPALDDRDRNGKLDDGIMSADSAFGLPTWFIISGGAGAPYYTQQRSPWEGSLVRFTAQNHYVLFHADDKRIGCRVYSVNGQLLDEEEDLLKVKHR